MEINTSMLFKLDFVNNTILLCLFFFFLIIELFYRYFLIAGVVVQIFNLTAKLAIPIEIPTKEAKAEIEIHPIIAAPKKKKSSI